MRAWLARGEWNLWALAAVLTTAVAYPWFVGLTGLAQGSWPYAVALLPLLVAFGLSAFVGGVAEKPIVRVAGLVCALGVTYFTVWISIPVTLRSVDGAIVDLAVVMVLPIGFALIQGVNRGAAGFDHARVYDSAVAHASIGLSGMLFAMIVGAGDVQPLMALAALSLFGAGLLLLIQSRARSLQIEQARMDGEGTRPANGSAVANAVTAAVLLLTIAVAAFFQTEQGRALASGAIHFMSAAYDGLVRLLLWVLTPVFFVIFAILQALFKTAIPEGYRRLQEAKPPQQAEQQPINAENITPASWDWLVPYLKVGLLVGGMAMLAYLVYRMQRQSVPKDLGESEERRTRMGFWSSLLEDLRMRSNVEGIPTVADDHLDAAHPRMLFRRLQRWGAHRGMVRGMAETPAHYAERLRSAGSFVADAAAIITEVYHAARYGGQPVAPDRLRRAAAAIDQLESNPGVGGNN